MPALLDLPASLAEVDPLQYPGPAWSPYVVGALIGVLSMLTFYFSNKPLGASTAYARVAGMIGGLLAPKHTRSLKYFQDKPPKVGWELMLWWLSLPVPFWRLGRAGSGPGSGCRRCGKTGLARTAIGCGPAWRLPAAC